MLYNKNVSLATVQDVQSTMPERLQSKTEEEGKIACLFS